MGGLLAKVSIFVATADDLAAEHLEMITAAGEGLIGETLLQQTKQKGLNGVDDALDDGQISPPGFTLLLEKLSIATGLEMTFSAAARLVGIPWHKATAICQRYVALGLAPAHFSGANCLEVNETSKGRGHDYITLVADANERRVLFVTAGKDAETIKAFARDFATYGSNRSPSMWWCMNWLTCTRRVTHRRFG